MVWVGQGREGGSGEEKERRRRFVRKDLVCKVEDRQERKKAGTRKKSGVDGSRTYRRGYGKGGMQA